jgi:hypothetical protein
MSVAPKMSKLRCAMQNNMPAAAAAPAQAHIIPNHAAQTTNAVQPIMQTYLRLNAVSE